MQRHSNVSVARLYDWSEQEKDEWLSVSRLYREIAGGVGVSLPRNLSEKVRPRAAANGAASGGPWTGAGTPRVNPGRMFLRDKGMLTKGEREIIQGIYKNRGDLRKQQLSNKSEFFVRSHHDAWLVGKPGAQGNKPSTDVPRESPRGSLMDVMALAKHDSPRPVAGDGSGGGDDRHGPAAHTTCIVCIREQQLLQQLQTQRQGQRHKQQHKTQALATPHGSVLRPIMVNDTFTPRGEHAPSGPPTSSSCAPPSKESHVRSVAVHHRPFSPSSRSRRQEITPVPLDPIPGSHSDSATPWVENGEGGSDSEGSLDSEANRRKLHVKIYLPQVAAEAAEEELRSNMLEGRPVLAREKHLTHTDLRKQRRAKEGGEQEAGVTKIQGPAHNTEFDSGREQCGEREVSRAVQVRARSGKRREDWSQWVNVGDLDSDVNKVNSRRVPLHTPPITILKADTQDNATHLD